MLTEKVKVVMYYPGHKKQKVMLTAFLLGTTFTGHPSSTTFGNTWRMSLYTMFIKRLHPEVKI
jgi:hypothetical protein